MMHRFRIGGMVTLMTGLVSAGCARHETPPPHSLSKDQAAGIPVWVLDRDVDRDILGKVAPDNTPADEPANPPQS